MIKLSYLLSSAAMLDRVYSHACITKPEKTVVPTKTPTKKPANKATAKPTASPKTKKPSIVGDGYIDPYTGQWFESEEVYKEWCKEELAKQTPTPVSRTELEKNRYITGMRILIW